MPENIEQRIKKLEKSNQLLVDNMYDAIWVIDVASMTFEYITPSIQQISGYSSEEYIGTPIKERMSEHTYENIISGLNHSLMQVEKGAEPMQALEVEMIHKNGGLYWVEIRAKLVQEKDKALKIVGVSRDITKRKKHEFSQEDLIRRLNAALEERQQLSAENKMLRELLPICSGCKRIRDDAERWWPLDIYIERNTHAKLTHTICPDCRSVIYEDA